jgi:hypothetical protein
MPSRLLAWIDRRASPIHCTLDHQADNHFHIPNQSTDRNKRVLVDLALARTGGILLEISKIVDPELAFCRNLDSLS